MKLHVRRHFFLKIVLVCFVMMTGPWAEAHGKGRGVEPERVDKVVCALLDQAVPSELIKRKEIHLKTFKLKAVSVEVLTQIPSVPITFVDINNKWIPLMMSKGLVDHWGRPMAEILEETFNNIHPRTIQDVDSKEIARDLCRLLVDPDGRYGVVLNTVTDIPVDYQSSDVYRDSVRAGMTRPQIKRKLLKKVVIPIDPPNVTKQDGGLCLRFFTWHYFGGELCQWTVLIGKSYEIRRKVISVAVGSYDYYM
jgi:hypothetical protein